MSDNRTVSVSTRIPQGWVAVIERHQQRMRATTRTPRVTLADALRDLIALGLEAMEPGIKLFGGQAEQLALPVEVTTPTVEAVASAPPGASAIEQAAAASLNPSMEPVLSGPTRLCKRGVSSSGTESWGRSQVLQKLSIMQIVMYAF